jgi:hypothetical protein
MIPDYNLLCQTRSLYNEPYHTVRPLLPIRMQHGLALTKLLVYSIMCALMTVVSLIVIVVLF